MGRSGWVITIIQTVPSRPSSHASADGDSRRRSPLPQTNSFTSEPGEKFIQELEAWWSLVSTWISIFTKQDFVEIGKTRSGIRVGPIVTWNGDADGLRVNGSKETSIPNVNDKGVEIVNHRTLLACTRLAANGTQPPDEWLFIRDARSLVNARQYRRAVIDAGTAAELAMTALIDPTLTGMNLLQREKLFEKNRGLWELSNLMLQQNAGTQARPFTAGSRRASKPSCARWRGAERSQGNRCDSYSS